MRGGRNKFGPIYRRDRALRRQIRSQLHTDPDLELVAKAAASATLAKADLEAIAKVAAATATTSKAYSVDTVRSYHLGLASSQPVSVNRASEVDVKPDTAELCGLVTGRDVLVNSSTSSYLHQQQQLCSSADYLPSTTTSCTSLGKSSSSSSYLTTATAVSTSLSSSDPLAGLSGMAAALLSQFLQQQRATLQTTATNMTTSLTSVPRAVLRTVEYSNNVSSSVYSTSSLPAQYSDMQHFNSRLGAATVMHPATPEKPTVISVVRTAPHSVTAQQYMIPVMTQTVSSEVSSQQSEIPALHVRPPEASHIRPDTSNIRPADSHVRPDVSHLRPADSRIRPPAVSQSAASSPSVSSGIHVVPAAGLATSTSSSLSSSGELQLSSLELSGVPATLRLIFDLKRQTGRAGGSECSGDRLRRFVEDLLQQPVSSSSVTSSLESAIQRAVALACRVCDQQLFLLVDWARQAHFFRHLSVNFSYLSA